MEYKSSKILKLCHVIWENGANDPRFLTWQRRARECFELFEGNQWEDNEIYAWREKGMSVVTCNLIKGYLELNLGELLQTETVNRVRAKSHIISSEETQKLSHKDLPKYIEEKFKNDSLLATALTSHGMNFMDENNISYLNSHIFKDAWICGVGAYERSFENNKFSLNYVNPLHLLYDASDISPNGAEARFIGCIKLVPRAIARKKWPKLSPNLGSREEDWKTDRAGKDNDGNLFDLTTTEAGRDSVIKYLEWKELMPSYSFQASNGRIGVVFDQDQANAMKQKGTDITEGKHLRVMRAKFCGDILLEFEKHPYFLPSREGFSIVPHIYRRKTTDNTFDGMVYPLKDVQKELNAFLTHQVYKFYSKKIVIAEDNLPKITVMGNKDPVTYITDALKTPNGVLIVKDPSRIVDISQKGDVQLSAGIISEFIQKFDSITGIHKEARGEQSNAQSGIAMQIRQVQSVKSKVFLFKEFEQFKKRVFQTIIEGLQDLYFMGRNIPTIMRDDYNTITNDRLLLNLERSEGNLINDIRFFPFDVLIEEEPFFRTIQEEQSAILAQVLQLPNAQLLMSSPSLLKKLVPKLDNVEEISAEFIQALENNMMIQLSLQQKAQMMQQATAGTTNRPTQEGE